MLEVGPETSAEPDTYEGVDGGRRYFAGFEGALDEVRFELLAVHEEAGDRLIADVKLSGLGAATRIPVEQTVRMLFEATPEGLITRVVARRAYSGVR